MTLLLVSADLRMPHRSEIDWEPAIYAYIDRCRQVAIKQAAPMKKWITFLRQAFCTQGVQELHLLGDVYFGVKPEVQE